LLRRLIAIGLHQPDLLLALDPGRLLDLELPGLDLLLSMQSAAYARPQLHTAGLLEILRDSPEIDVLHRLAAAQLELDDAALKREFEDGLKKLYEQARKDRIDQLNAMAELSAEQKQELMQLLYRVN
jgi:hypothetical protein